MAVTTEAQVIDKIREALIDNVVADEKDLANPLPRSLEFEADLGMDSLDMIELAMGMEEAFEGRVIEIQDDDIFTLTTVGVMADYILKRLGG